MVDLSKQILAVADLVENVWGANMREPVKELRTIAVEVEAMLSVVKAAIDVDETYYADGFGASPRHKEMMSLRDALQPFLEASE